MKILKWLDENFEETLLVILLVLISCVELVQVIVRNVPFIPALKWAEEFCRFCWIWSVFISLPHTIRRSGMLRVSVLLDLFPQTGKKIMNIIVDIVTAAYMFILGYHSISVIQRIMNSGETSPAMVWPMWIVYTIILFGFFAGGLRALQQVWLHIRSFSEKSKTTLEMTLDEAAAEAEAVNSL